MDKGQLQRRRGLEVCIGSCCFTGDTTKDGTITEELQGGHRAKSASAVVMPEPDHRWDYSSEAKAYLNGNLELTGVCTGAKLTPDGGIVVSLHDHSWIFDHATIKNLEMFGMTPEEHLYWLPQLTGLVRGVTVPGLTLDTQLRPFLYAVPLSGITAKGEPKSFLINDLGVAAGDRDNTFAPLLAKLNISKKGTVWHPDVPKAYGVVFATDLMEAERRALDRAQFTADLIGFALRAGMSHLEDRWQAQPLPWNGEQGRGLQSLFILGC